MQQMNFQEQSRGCTDHIEEGSSRNICNQQGSRKHLQSWSEGYIIRMQIKTGELVKQAERK